MKQSCKVRSVYGFIYDFEEFEAFGIKTNVNIFIDPFEKKSILYCFDFVC